MPSTICQLLYPLLIHSWLKKICKELFLYFWKMNRNSYKIYLYKSLSIPFNPVSRVLKPQRAKPLSYLYVGVLIQTAYNLITHSISLPREVPLNCYSRKLSAVFVAQRQQWGQNNRFNYLGRSTFTRPFDGGDISMLPHTAPLFPRLV